MITVQSQDDQDMTEWDRICYCTMNNALHPQTIVNADNNWQLLLSMKDGLTLNELDSISIPYTKSQLLLLRSQRLLKQTRRDQYQTMIPILDKTQTTALRKQSLSVAENIYPEIETECKDLIAYLSGKNMSGNAFSILFSYVLDGLIWKRFEKEEIIEKRNGSGIWSGSYWFMTPKRSFTCGTNSISEGGESVLRVNWSKSSNDLMDGFYRLNFEDLLNSVERYHRITDQTISEFSKFGFFDQNANLAIPVIDESNSNELYLSSNKIIDKLFPAFIKSADIESLKKSYNFKDTSETVVIFYHEVMWEILNLFLERQVVQIPVAFKSSGKASSMDIAELCFITIRK